MNITLDQAFYGRGERGYGVLGISSEITGLASRIEAFCASVGTPSGDYGGEPFLMSVPDGGRVFMFCGRRGAPDSMGRATLFFHVLVAEKDVLVAAKADAFSLFAQGAFTDKMPIGNVAALSLDASGSTNSVDGHPPCGMNTLNVTLPCMFRFGKPATELVHAAIGTRANELAWTTFAFQALPDFDVQVLPPRVQGPRTVNEYDASAHLVSRASVVDAPQPEEPLYPDRKQEMSPPYSSTSTASLSEKSNVMIKLSFVANFVLIAVCAMLLVSRKSMSPSPANATDQIVITNFVEKVVEKPVVTPLSDEQKVAIEEVAIERYRSKLINAFPVKALIKDFDDEIINCELFKPAYGNKYDNPSGSAEQKREYQRKYRNANTFLKKLKSYVNFLNTNLLKGKNP